MTAILYSYRRCPYAMRARMALKYAGIEVQIREISLRDKPISMLQISPKGTVPVLKTDDLVLEQSIDIMRWALERSDPDAWLSVDLDLAQAWLAKNDGPFKKLLDQYKYPNRYPELLPAQVLDGAIELMLQPIESVLESHPYLMGAKLSWVDIAIFPFMRQFSMVNPQQFEGLPFPKLKRWLADRLESKLFQSVMEKYPTWIE
ncbi:glutathione S-transferase [Polynucleobacter tropicus]|uniref:Glutathione S-transferase n=1 Tax=Polynucleobacter tropicus TaxID=1743174 RepID=A0A6M9PX74_9BURK|nr:glutathione S-transferase [Polynucleobacter tropicus]QKM64881.1 glutathione S-transferase [Polynucleobacter tropicus]